MADHIKKDGEKKPFADMQKTIEMPAAPYSEEELLALKAYSPLSEVEKNIDEAERYIDAIMGGKTAKKADPKPSFSSDDVCDLNSTEEISRFEPKDILFEEIPKPSEAETEIFSVGGKWSLEDAEDARTEIFGLALDGETVEAEIVTEEETHADETGETVDISVLREELRKKEKKQKKETQYHGFEYTDESQKKEILATMRSRYLLSKIRLAVALIFAAALFAVENIAAVRTVFPSGTAYIITDWVLTLACASLIFDRLGGAIRSLFKFRVNADTLTLGALLFSMAATSAALLGETLENADMLYNFPFAVCVVLNAVYVFYTWRRDILSFKILSSANVKRAIQLHDADTEISPEIVAFSDQLSETGKKYGTVRTADFIDDYFEHKEEVSSAALPLKFFLPFCFFITVLIFLGSFFLAKHSVSQSLGVAYASFMMCAPFSAFIAYCYPSYVASRRAYSYRSAILCDKTSELYRDAALVAFNDTDVFSGAKIKGVKLYADRKIDQAIRYAHLAYAALGGPLASVFARADVHTEEMENVQLREIAKDGVCVIIGDKNIVIGTPEYMEAQCFETNFERGDEDYTGNSVKRIFYLACDQVVIAKFYVQYQISSDFIDIARYLSEAGIGVSVRTADPSLDDGVFYRGKLDQRRYFARVIEGYQVDEMHVGALSAKQAGVLSIGSNKEMVRAMLLCGRVESVKRMNLILQIVSCILGFAVMTLVLFSGKACGMLSVYPMLYQIFWLLPIYFVSKIYI